MLNGALVLHQKSGAPRRFTQSWSLKKRVPTAGPASWGLG